MSGICAVWKKDNPGACAAALGRIASGLRFRREERVSTEAAGAAGVGAASYFETQQLYRGERTIVTCDADLRNESDLAALVPATQPAPAGASTAALLAALYERFGDAFVEKLEGAFSLILWDARLNKLIAAVDGFGVKRLAYYQESDRLFFSSRIDALMRTGEVDSAINPRAIPNVLNYTANLAPETIYRRVKRLAPGTIVTAINGRVDFRAYWDVRYADSSRSAQSLDAMGDSVRRIVGDSVGSCWGAEGSEAVGAFLSGGTDSSAVVGLMSGLGRGTVKAFSIGFQEQEFNELHYAELAAKKFGASHHTYLVGPDDCFNALQTMVRYYDEPYGNSSAIPTYFCARLAAQHGVTHMLAGDGGDELFGGNEHYRIDKIFHVYHHVPAFLRKGVIEPALGLGIGNGMAQKARNYVRRANLPGPERMLSFQFLSTHDPKEVFEGSFLESLAGYTIADIPNHHYRTASASEHLNRLLYLDMKITLADNDLPKVTGMTELAGVGVRFPYLSRSVAEYCGGIPAKYKLNGFEKRYLFKQAFRKLLPPEIISKKKHGFGIPVAGWLKTHPGLRELARDTLTSRRCLTRGYFQRQFLDKIFRDHESDQSTYYGDTLWTLLALELWHVQSPDREAGAAA